MEVSGQWVIKTRYVPGASVDRRVAMPVLGLAAGKTRGIHVDTATGDVASREYYHHDRLGHVIAMAGEWGNVRASYVYTPYGVEDYGASGNQFRYTGRRYDASVGLYYYRARYGACPRACAARKTRGIPSTADSCRPTRCSTKTR